MGRFKGIYWRTFTVTVGMVALTLVLLGASFFALTYSYIMSEKRGELEDKAEIITQLAVSAYERPDVLQFWGGVSTDLAELLDVAQRMSDTNFLIWMPSLGGYISTDISINNTTFSLPKDITSRLSRGDRYAGTTDLGIYEKPRFVVAVPARTSETGIVVGPVLAIAEPNAMTEMWGAFMGIFGMTAITVLLIAFVATATTTMQQTKPIRDMAAAARRFAEGNFDARVHNTNREDEIVRCLRCFTCMAERPTTGTRRCTVNPLIGREVEGMEVRPAAVKKNVVVAGGGVGGMKAALTAAQRGHSVILLEKTGELGGILKSEQALPFKYEMYQLGLTLARQLELAGVEVRLNTEATPELLHELAPEALILAVGSSPIVPPLPGIDGDNVVIVNNYYLEKEKVGDSVVVLGGGLAGCECAVHLGMEGKAVHLVEMRDSLAVDCNIRHRPILMEKVDQYATVHLEHAGLRITPEGLVCRDKEGREVLIPGETVICAVGQRSNRDAVMTLRSCAPWVREIGD